MTTAPVDPRLAMEAASTQELAQRKLAMDNLRHRLGDTRTKEEKLRESCEGFESIFVQKMWEQMRKNVKKEGYLHSKDEEFYQSMFDQELAKKMTSAGGIGLADMLEQQLTQRLNHSSKHTSGGARVPAKGEAAAPKMNAEELYSPVEEAPEEPATNPEVLKALSELKREQEQDAGTMDPSQMKPAQSLAATMPALQPSVQAAPERVAPPPAMPAKVLAPGKARPVRRSVSKAGGGPGAGRQSAAVSSAPAPSSAFAPPRSAAMQSPQASPAGQAGQAGQATGQTGQTTGPTTGQAGPGSVSNGYGWSHDQVSGEKRWHSGVDIAAGEGQAVAALQAGTVIFAGEQDGYGHLTVLEHADGTRGYYGNARAEGVNVGDAVDTGAKIAIVAMRSAKTTDASEAHLHFELRRGELAVNPERAVEAALSGFRAETGLA